MILGFNRERVGAVVEENIMPTLQAAAGTSGNNKPMIAKESESMAIVRRLSPLECTRLQGYP